MFCLKAPHIPRYQEFSEKMSCLNNIFVLISCSRQHTVANQSGKISRARKYSKLIGFSAAGVHFFNCENKEDVQLRMSIKIIPHILNIKFV